MLKMFLTLVVYKCIWCIFSVEKTISIACFDGNEIDHSRINLFLIHNSSMVLYFFEYKKIFYQHRIWVVLGNIDYARPTKYSEETFKLLFRENYHDLRHFYCIAHTVRITETTMKQQKTQMFESLFSGFHYVTWPCYKTLI